MAKSRALIAAEAKVAALEARLALAAECYRNQKGRIAELEAQLAARGAAKVIPEPKTWTWQKRDGSVWESTRTGTQVRSRCVQAAPAAA